MPTSAKLILEELLGGLYKYCIRRKSIQKIGRLPSFTTTNKILKRKLDKFVKNLSI